MNCSGILFKYKVEWRKLIRKKNDLVVRTPALALSGPSGVGKTTVVKLMAKDYPVFVETTQGNPHLIGLLEGKGNFDAAANQDWFLKQLGKHIKQSDNSLPLILDQDPSAVVLAYAKMFLEDGKMSRSEYTKLFQQLLDIEKDLHAWRCPRIVIFLDAPVEVLHQRALQRQGMKRTPPLEWFDRLRNQFGQLFTLLPNAITVSTVEFSPEQIALRAKAIIEEGPKDAQAGASPSGSHGCA